MDGLGFRQIKELNVGICNALLARMQDDILTAPTKTCASGCRSNTTVNRLLVHEIPTLCAGVHGTYHKWFVLCISLGCVLRSG